MNGERRKDSELGQSIKWEKANVWNGCLRLFVKSTQ